MCTNTNLGLLCLIGILVIGVAFTTYGQNNLLRNITDEGASEKLSELFHEYALKVPDKERSFKRNLDDRYEMYLNGEQIALTLTPANLLSDNYSIQTSDHIGIEKIRNEIATPYKGFVVGDPSSQVRVTIGEDYIYGFITIQKKKYFIEPANKFDPSLKSNVHIVYTQEQIKEGNEMTCASGQAQREVKRTSAQLKSATCQMAELAIALDDAYRLAHGGSTGAINQSVSVMNMVAGVYENAFNDDIQFEIVTHYVSTCSSCDPWTSSTDANTLLTDFSNWGSAGFGVTHDIGQLWTGRNLCAPGDCSVAGLAWIGAVCGAYRYHILEDFTTTAWQLRVLVSHEMGHNFGANHDAASSNHVMRPSIAVNTTTWSNQSKSEINAALTSFTCLEDCVTGSCSEILSISTLNCVPGNPGTYDLQVEIRHGGGGTSSSFDIIVNGGSYNFNWSASPQTVLITGLVADGTTANNISVAADDGSDSGCSGSEIYDEPANDCTLVVLEDFDDCTLPNGWNSSTTNGFIWNGGDPLVQYEWKFDDATRYFGNYDDGENANSLKTIDGTCMALMDDDIIFHDLYTGDVTLTSPVYDISDFDTIKLQFDYNFHPFEDGGKGANDSYFKVEIFDGASWITILTDSDSGCPWSNVWPSTCATYADLDVSAYLSQEFQFRFIYSDGNTGAWAGMIALDNIALTATVEAAAPNCSDGIMNGDETGVDCGGSCPPCDPDCEPVVVITPATQGGVQEARDMIMTVGVIEISENSIWSADNIEITSSLEVPSNTTFRVDNNGCN